MVTNVKKFESIIHGAGDPRPQPLVYNFAPPSSSSKDTFVKGKDEARALASIEKGGVAGQAEIAPPKSFAGLSRFRS